MIPTWLQVFAYIWLGLSAISFLIVVIDAPRQNVSMPIMKLVWPLTTLYMGPIGLYAYFKLGRNVPMMHHRTKPFWQSVFVSSTHCGGGCSLGDAIGGPVVFGLGLMVAGSSLFADYIIEFVLAYLFGIAFQYFGMGFTNLESLGQGLKNAIKADTWSLIAYEIGMFGWMALVHVFFVHVPEPNHPLYWFMMQIAMMIGFATSYPANWVLVKKGIKHAM